MSEAFNENFRESLTRVPQIFNNYFVKASGMLEGLAARLAPADEKFPRRVRDRIGSDCYPETFHARVRDRPRRMRCLTCGTAANTLRVSKLRGGTRLAI